MADVQLPSELLISLIRVLERVEERLEKLDKHFDHTQSLYTLDPTRKPGLSQINLEYNEPVISNAALRESPQTQDSARQHPVVTKVRYSDWSENSRGLQFEAEGEALLQRYLGDYWKVPNDNRLPTFKPNLKERLDVLRQFDTQLRTEKGNDFVVVDYDLMNNTRIYRIGEAAIGSELMVDPAQLDNAPWSRLILYQGMTTGNSINPDNNTFQEGLPEQIPYFGRGSSSTGLWSHINSHLQLKPRDSTTNPYLNADTGFHITFYEIRAGEHLGLNEVWRHGPLYDHPNGWHFRKSAYTLYIPTGAATLAGDVSDRENLTRHWSILILAPDYFFDENNTSFPLQALPPGSSGHRLGKLTQQGAEMNLIGQGLERISERWAAFQSYFDYILDGGDSLMQPNEHDNLLFDDGAFSRSRRYFWAIDCLSEFETCISDNIAQWEMYKQARVTPLFSSSILPDLDLTQFRNAERQYHILQNQREYFRRKLASTKALRDALFNASAVIESRASTRLGENVKLLAFVSIFFLPLSFCTSLWSINDKFSTNSLFIIIALVACTTYFTIFNLNRLVNIIARIYAAKKVHVVTQMKSDSRQAWNKRGHRFEVFRPKHENPEPSEWYVALYTLLNPALVLGLRRRRGVGVWRWGWWRGKKKMMQMGKDEEVENDLPWVLSLRQVSSGV